MNKLELFIDCSRNENDELCIVNGIRGNNMKLPRLDIFKSSFDSVKDEDIPFGMKEDVSVEEGENEVSLRFTENLIDKTFESLKKLCQTQADVKKLAKKFLEFYNSLSDDVRPDIDEFFESFNFDIEVVKEIIEFPNLSIEKNKESVNEGDDDNDSAEEVKEAEIISKSSVIYNFLALMSSSNLNVNNHLKNIVDFVNLLKGMIDDEKGLEISDEHKALIKFVYKELIKIVGGESDEAKDKFLKSFDDVEKYKNLIFKIPKIHAIMTNAIIDDLVVIGIKKFPVMKLIQEVDRSVDEEKDIYIVENYEDYYNNVVRKSNPEYKYIRFDYGTVEWSDVVLDLKDNEGMNLQDRILDGELDFGEMRNLLD